MIYFVIFFSPGENSLKFCWTKIFRPLNTRFLNFYSCSDLQIQIYCSEKIAAFKGSVPCRVACMLFYLTVLILIFVYCSFSVRTNVKKSYSVAQPILVITRVMALIENIYRFSLKHKTIKKPKTSQQNSDHENQE